MSNNPGTAQQILQDFHDSMTNLEDEDDIRYLQRRIQFMQEINDSLQCQVEFFHRENQDLRSRVAKLNSELFDAKRDIHDLKVDIESLQARNERTKDELRLVEDSN
ncbi:hypothetical protein BDV96DRAFT_661068 [Lophiotrema nucula]|uniref:Uncharacterized protein n=1 Tax=Lophiotrema nucula TaxID=690887 RepID=A0A6A5Z8D8_9PLEO|nr:hypothetical protein BDV96DRAFT_661068 [Lophiotrema nucula]